ncbi:MAG: rhodanese-like domain-containing protein [Coriobacteriia bacterium]|nr:rhodanese-like domain-containing protein [Coriobacteriia bacterium]
MRKNVLIVSAIALVAVVAIGLMLAPSGGTSAGYSSTGWPESRDVNNAELKDFVSKGARLIDVRTAGEFTGGHIDKAENVSIDAVPTQASSWDKQQPIVVYCQTGARSLNAFQYLQAQGFTRVYNLAGGVSQWDGQLVQGAATSTGDATGPVTALPTMYEFSSET